MFFKRWFLLNNAKDIGTLYLIFALFSGLLGTAFSVLMRLELCGPVVQYIADNQLYNAIITAHAILMILFMVIPAMIGGFGNFLLQFLIGRDIFSYLRWLILCYLKENSTSRSEDCMVLAISGIAVYIFMFFNYKLILLGITQIIGSSLLLVAMSMFVTATLMLMNSLLKGNTPDLISLVCYAFISGASVGIKEEIGILYNFIILWPLIPLVWTIMVDFLFNINVNNLSSIFNLNLTPWEVIYLRSRRDNLGSQSRKLVTNLSKHPSAYDFGVASWQKILYHSKVEEIVNLELEREGITRTLEASGVRVERKSSIVTTFVISELSRPWS